MYDISVDIKKDKYKEKDKDTGKVYLKINFNQSMMADDLTRTFSCLNFQVQIFLI